MALDRAKASSGRALTVAIDAFNVLNRVNDTAYIGTLTSPFFGTAVAAQPATDPTIGSREILASLKSFAV